MSLFEEFKQFVADQPSDQKINHNGTWSACAVGDFARSIKTYDGNVVDAIREGDERIYACLNQSGRSHIAYGEWFEGVDITTYGKLASYLNGVDGVSVAADEHSVSVVG
ncbi:hypothetical protein D3C80_1862550 [compost metagenome]